MANDRSQNQPDSAEGNKTNRGQDGRTGGKISKGGSMNEDRRTEEESEEIQATAANESDPRKSGQGKPGSQGGRQGQPNTGDQSEDVEERRGNQGGKR